MFLFLVRHARSENPADYWQTPDSELSKIGKRQAEILSKRSRFSNLDKILSSNWERSKKTAEIISTSLHVNKKILGYIHEREQLSQMYGVARNSDLSKKYVEEYCKNYKNLDWKFEGKEESIREVLMRASRLSKFLIKNYKDKKVLVISHDMFIRSYISMTMLGENCPDKTMANAINSLTINYTGISLLIYNNQSKIWKVNYINDYSHLKHLSKYKG